MQNIQHNQWRGRTDGTPFMQRTLVALMHVVPVEVIYCFMALVVPFYIIFRWKSFLAIYHFFHQRIGKNRFAAAWHTVCNHLMFGQVVVDRFASFAGQHFHLTIDGYDHFLQLADKPTGFLMLSAHVGNYEMAGYELRSEKKDIYALVYDSESEVILQGRNKRLNDHRIHILPLSNDMSHMFAISNALDDGNIVSMAADRIHGSTKQISCPFMGATAHFPMGPFATAVQKEVASVAVNVVKRRWRHYHIYVVPLELPNNHLPRNERIQRLAQAYVAALEDTVHRHPNQWYNYYEFWNGK